MKKYLVFYGNDKEKRCVHKEEVKPGGEISYLRRNDQGERCVPLRDSKNANSGITLVALVVTLVVLLILAGITISVVLSEGGIIAKAQSSKEKQEVAVWLDRLTVTEANTAVTNYTVDLEKYNAQLKTEGIVLESNSNYQSEDGGVTYNLTTDNGYVFNISEPTPGDIVINYIGKNGELLPYIKEIKVISTTTNSSKIEVEVARLEDGKLTYEYKKHTEENYTLLKENKELIAEFTELAQNETYDIKVTAENKNGKSEAKIISIYTGKLQEGTISQKGETIWTNGQASIELQTTDTENTMQYQKNGIAGSWTNYTTTIAGLVHRDIIYARMFDGTNGTTPFSVNIMDGIAPTVNVTIGSITENSFIVSATANDTKSGIAKIEYSKDNGTTYLVSSPVTNPNYIFNGLSENTTYNVKVKVTDNAGNQAISETIPVTTKTTTVSNIVKPGDYITYTPGAGSYTGRWQILYNNGNGVEIISSDIVVSDLRVGARYDYNNLVSILNTESSKYVNSKVASRGRSVGSSPTKPEGITTLYKDTSKGSRPYISQYASDAIADDTLYVNDYNTMKSLNMHNIGKNYYLASRYADNDWNAEEFTCFYTRFVDNSGADRYDRLWSVMAGSDSYTYTLFYGLRPVILLKSTTKITGGDGSINNPYTIQ